MLTDSDKFKDLQQNECLYFFDTAIDEHEHEEKQNIRKSSVTSLNDLADETVITNPAVKYDTVCGHMDNCQVWFCSRATHSLIHPSMHPTKALTHAELMRS